MNDISYDEMIKIITENKSIFLCGNGFSINFDDRYKCQNLMDSLYSTHCHVLKNSNFIVNANEQFNTALLTNYQSVLTEISNVQTEKEFIAIFDDAIKFANTIIYNHNALNWLKANGDTQLTFGFSISELIQTISQQANATAAKAMGVNYEYWTILIYCVIAMEKAPKTIYLLDTQNIFVKLVLKGKIYTWTKKDVYNDTITNGLYIYFWLLFAGNILLQGDSFNVNRLKNWNFYNFTVLNRFLSNFDFLMTTNYDRILEKITDRFVQHLHGYYDKKTKTVLYQTLSVTYSPEKYDLSSIIIGDYFISKTRYLKSAFLARKFPQNTNIKAYDEMLTENMEKYNANVILIFGLNIDNDYHIIRSIQVHLAKLKNAHIIYCYFTPEDKDLFKQKYQQVITPPVSKHAVQNISVSFVKSQEVIANIFKEK